MTGPRPKTNNGRLAIQYVTGSGLTHRCNLDVQIDNPDAGAPYSLVQLEDLPILWSDAATQFTTLAKALFAADASLQIAELYRYNAGVYIQLDVFSIGVLGTNGATSTKAQEETFVFYDAAHHLDKIVFLETGYTGVDHNALAGLAVAEAAFVTDVLDQAGGHIGAWYESKGGVGLARFLARTKTYNRRLRRKEGLS